MPRSVYGAPEWVVLTRISLPLVKPILAVSTLYAFLAAYNGWEWALIVCQATDRHWHRRAPPYAGGAGSG